MSQNVTDKKSTFGSGNGLVLSDNKPLPEPNLTKIYGAIWLHQATLSWCTRVTYSIHVLVLVRVLAILLINWYWFKQWHCSCTIHYLIKLMMTKMFHVKWCQQATMSQVHVLTSLNIWLHVGDSPSTHGGLNKMAPILQTTFWYAFLFTKIIFWLKFHRSMSPRVQSTSSQHWVQIYNSFAPNRWQAIAWSHVDPALWHNVDWSSVRSAGIHLRAISQEMLKMSILDMSLKVADLVLQICIFQGPMS